MKVKLYKLLTFAITFFSLQQIIYPQDVPYVPTSYEVVDAMLKLANVTKDDVVYDLGCGDGRIVVMAAKDFGARGFGVDSNPKRIEESNQNANDNNVTDKVKFDVQNLFETDLSEATVVTLYLLNAVNLKLRPKLFRELKPGTRVVSNSFDMDDWRPDNRIVVDQRNIYFWKIPHNVSGKWEGNVSGDTDENYIFQLDQEFQNVSGSVQIGEENYNIKEAKLNGDEFGFKFNVKDNGKLSEVIFAGKINDDNLQGKVITGNNNHELEVTRAAGTMKPLDPTDIK